MIERAGEQCAYFQFEQLNQVSSLRHGVFTRKGGVSQPPFDGLNVSISTGDDPDAARANQRLVSRAVGLPLISARIMHGDQVCVVEREKDETLDDLRARLRWLPADAMVTTEPGLGLFWGFGDCAPILLYDPHHHVVALAHGGWRGAAGAIGPKTIAAMAERYGSRAEDLVAGVGPAIQACCYQVDDNVRQTFAREPIAHENVVFETHADADGREALFLDVTASNAQQLLAAGVRQERMEVAPFCTGCADDLFYSHRKRPHADGRFGVVIGLVA